MTIRITTLLGSSKKRGNGIGRLVTGADAYADNAEGMSPAFHGIVDFLLAKKSGELYVGECSEPSALSEAVKDKASDLAGSLES